jgi:hypothetical protein
MSTVAEITIDLDKQLLQDAEKLAADTGRTLSELIEDALRETLSNLCNAGSSQSWELPTFGMGGVMPGVDLNNSAALLDIMNAEEYVERYDGPYH